MTRALMDITCNSGIVRAFSGLAIATLLLLEPASAASPFAETSETYFRERVGSRSADEFCFKHIISIGWNEQRLSGQLLEKFKLFKTVFQTKFTLNSRFIVFYQDQQADDEDLKGPSTAPHAWIEYQYDGEVSEYKGIATCGSSMLYPNAFDPSGTKIEQEYFDFLGKRATVSGWKK